MKVLLKMVAADLVMHRVRFTLTTLAVALAVSLVVATTGGYASMMRLATGLFDQFLGASDINITRMDRTSESVSVRVARRVVEPFVGRRADVLFDLLPANASRQSISAASVDKIRADPDVIRVTRRLELSLRMTSVAGQPVGTFSQIIGVEPETDPGLGAMRVDAGKWFTATGGDVAVLDQITARRLFNTETAQKDGEKAPQLSLGDTFTLPGRPPRQLTVAAVIRKPAVLAIAPTTTVYLPLATLQKHAMSGRDEVNRVNVTLRPGADVDAAIERIAKSLEPVQGGMRLKNNGQSRRRVDREMESMQVLTYLGSTVTLLAAGFIVFSTLSMGVAERTRVLAMMRAVGMLRRHVALLVIFEALAVGLVGGAVGVGLGFIWLQILGALFSDVLAAGVMLDGLGVVLGVGGALVAALVAAAIPAWNASRVSPLAAMAGIGSAAAGRVPWRSFAVGLTLALVDSFLLFGPMKTLAKAAGSADPVQAARDFVFVAHYFLGIPLLFFGFFLMSPMFVRAVEIIGTPLVARLLRVRPELIRQQLSAGLWRAAGTASALMVGLSVLVVMQTQGRSVLGAWKLPNKFPDFFAVSSSLDGIPPHKVRQIAGSRLIRNKEVVPVAFNPVALVGNFFSLKTAEVLSNNTLMFAIEPESALKWLDMEFTDGNAAEATALMARGRHVIVTEEFRKLRNLNVGSKIEFDRPRGLGLGSGGTVTYTVAGVVRSPGLDVFVALFDLSDNIDQRSTSCVFVGFEDADRDFGIGYPRMLAMNLAPGVRREDMLREFDDLLGPGSVNVGDVREIKSRIEYGFGQILLLSTTVAVAAMAVASLGVMNTIVASVRSRRWQFGILRAVGVTRGQLLRVVIAEALLLAIVGAALGIASGLIMSANAQKLLIVLAGFDPPMVIPWAMIALGALGVGVTALLASAYPATSTARTPVLSLLQAGRAAS